VLILAMGLVTVLAALWTLRQALDPLKQIASTMEARASSDLSPLNQVVPAEIHSLVAAINEFMHRLAVHRTMMRGVIRDAAHQLRTPVAAMLSQMELLHLHADPASQARHLGRLHSLTRSLGELVNQLINHAMVQLRAESVPLETIDLAALAREAMADRLSQTQHPHLDVGFAAPDGPCPIQGDAIALREALKNLLDNALKYGAKGLLHMELRATPQAWELRVEDDGPGIAEDQWTQVRQPFSARSSQRDGASLGLAIVNEVMRAHGGHMQFSWSPERHFVVLLHFPFA
jgi:two-component system sensor histidine kinase TctE